MKRLGLTALLGLLANTAACVPNLGRTNARLEDGVDFAVSAGPAFVAPGEGTNSNADETHFWAQFEVDLQYAKQKENQSGFAIQVKMPLTFVFTTLDAYLELPSRHPHYYGVGVEVGLVTGAYGAYSYYFTKNGYVTITPRIHVYLGGLNNSTDSESRIWINPQVAMGFISPSGLVDTSIFFGYNRLLGKGVDFCIYDCDTTDFRNQFYLAGAQLRF